MLPLPETRVRTSEASSTQTRSLHCSHFTRDVYRSHRRARTFGCSPRSNPAVDLAATRLRRGVSVHSSPATGGDSPHTPTPDVPRVHSWKHRLRGPGVSPFRCNHTSLVTSFGTTRASHHSRPLVAPIASFSPVPFRRRVQLIPGIHRHQFSTTHANHMPHINPLPTHPSTQLFPRSRHQSLSHLVETAPASRGACAGSLASPPAARSPTLAALQRCVYATAVTSESPDPTSRVFPLSLRQVTPESRPSDVNVDSRSCLALNANGTAPIDACFQPKAPLQPAPDGPGLAHAPHAS